MVDVPGVAFVAVPQTYCAVIGSRHELLSGGREFNVHNSCDVVLEYVQSSVYLPRVEYIG